MSEVVIKSFENGGIWVYASRPRFRHFHISSFIIIFFFLFFLVFNKNVYWHMRKIKKIYF